MTSSYSHKCPQWLQRTSVLAKASKAFISWLYIHNGDSYQYHLAYIIRSATVELFLSNGNGCEHMLYTTLDKTVHSFLSIFFAGWLYNLTHQSVRLQHLYLYICPLFYLFVLYSTCFSFHCLQITFAQCFKQ